MPIRPELRHLYGAAHRAARLALIAERGSACSACGRVCERYLNLCHVSHDPMNDGSRRLMCAACHCRHDAGHRQAMMRRRRAQRSGQLWLYPEIQWDAHAVWEIPPSELVAAAQGKLF